MPKLDKSGCEWQREMGLLTCLCWLLGVCVGFSCFVCNSCCKCLAWAVASRIKGGEGDQQCWLSRCEKTGMGLGWETAKGVDVQLGWEPERTTSPVQNFDQSLELVPTSLHAQEDELLDDTLWCCYCCSGLELWGKKKANELHGVRTRPLNVQSLQTSSSIMVEARSIKKKQNKKTE